jgi:pimeloyl-ACP methyl ester carboxylesterase
VAPGSGDRGSTAGTPQLLAQLEAHIVLDAAHWVQQEKPDEVNSMLVSWLQRVMV